MKKHIRLLSVLSFSLVLSAPLLSQTGSGKDVRKQKLINRSYPVTADDKLVIDNQFGNVVVSTWDEQKITVDIEIGALASTDEKAQDILEQIDVKETKGDHEIAFKTNVGEIHNGNTRHHGGDGDNRSFYIDYIIHMPATNRLAIENNFGKTEIPAFKGLVTLTSKYGSLNTGKLDNVDMIDVEFGRATITEIGNGKVIFKYDGESRIGKVGGNVKITSEFSSQLQLNIADNIEELTVLESYSGVRMIVDKSLSAQIDVHTSFGNFHNESEISISEHKEDPDDYGPHFDKDYSGQAGDGKAKIRVKSSFGSVRLSYHNGNDNNDNDDDKGKDKHKDKDKHEHGEVSVS